MTRKSYNDLQEELRQAQQYINNLIHNDYDVVNHIAWYYEGLKVIESVVEVALIKVVDDKHLLDAPMDTIKRALHIRHPHVLLVGQPYYKELIFIALLSQDADIWTERVQSSLNKNKIKSYAATIHYNGNVNMSTLTLLEIILAKEGSKCSLPFYS